MREEDLQRLLRLHDDKESDDDDAAAPEVVRERLREALLRLREMRALYRNVVDQLPAFLYIDSPKLDGPTYYASPKIFEILGITPQEYIDAADEWWNMIHPDDRQRAIDVYESYIRTGQPDRGDFRYVRPDGKVIWIHDRSSMICDEDGVPMICQGVMFDITDQKEAELRIQHMAYHDGLTGLPNRDMFTEHLELALARARRDDLGVAVLFLDLDQFKLVNDSLGHGEGDALLVQVADRLREATRDTDLVARQGGDEFLVLVADLERGEHGSDRAVRAAEGVADRIIQAFRDPFVVSGVQVHASSSIGISVFPEDARDAKDLMKNADAAMYVNKRSGSDRYAVHPGAGDAAHRMPAVGRLRGAVEEQNWELHYQPIVELASGDVTAVEALLRWRHPAGGLTKPGEFIPLAEEMGMIQSIGRWVFGEVCSQAERWHRSGLDLDVSINVSPLQLTDDRLSDEIVEELDLRGLPHECLIVELTESSAMTDPERVQQVLWELRARGLRIAIEDFGMGASSLSRLRYLPVEILKIDRSFIHDAPEHDDAADMVDSIVDLARRLDAVPLAEAVETQAQRAFLAQRDCKLAQGYLFCRPVPAEELTARISSGELRLPSRRTQRV